MRPGKALAVSLNHGDWPVSIAALPSKGKKTKSRFTPQTTTNGRFNGNVLRMSESSTPAIRLSEFFNPLTP